MSDEQLRDEVLTIFLAGYETVANALDVDVDVAGPESRGRSADACRDRRGARRDESPTLDDLPRLKYTEMVMAESMRIYPPAWAMGRQATRDIEMGPYKLPAGSYLFFSQYIMQRSAEQFPDPLRFDPERFTAEAKARAAEVRLLPVWRREPAVHRRGFRVDGRECLLLATIAQRWRLRLVPGQTIGVAPKITLRPDGPIWVVPELR